MSQSAYRHEMMAGVLTRRAGKNVLRLAPSRGCQIKHLCQIAPATNASDVVFCPVRAERLVNVDAFHGHVAGIQQELNLLSLARKPIRTKDPIGAHTLTPDSRDTDAARRCFVGSTTAAGSCPICSGASVRSRTYPSRRVERAISLSVPWTLHHCPHEYTAHPASAHRCGLV